MKINTSSATTATVVLVAAFNAALVTSQTHANGQRDCSDPSFTDVVCGPSSYIAGNCSLGDVEEVCTTCSNIDCVYGRTYRSGSCSPSAGNNFQCTPCDNRNGCPGDQVRAGTCAGTFNGFTCEACAACSDATYKVVSCSRDSQSVCLPLTFCGNDEHEIREPQRDESSNEYTTNRVCTTSSTCTDDQFELPRNRSSDRVCERVQVCSERGANFYESTPPTWSSDRSCTAATICEVTQYETVAMTATSDRQCSSVPMDICDRNQYIMTSRTPTSARLCANLTSCVTPENDRFMQTRPVRNNAGGGYYRSNRVCGTIAAVCGGPGAYTSYSGQFSELPSYTNAGPIQTDNYIMSGTATMRLGLASDGSPQVTTTVVVRGTGNNGTTGATGTFNAHLHSQPCAQDGGHYMNDASGPVDATNENWPILQCTGEATCRSEATNAWQPTAAAITTGLSIVIHNTPRAESGSGLKYVCADLALGPGWSGAQYQTRAPISGNGGSRNRLCSPVASCDLNSYETVAPTATTDRQCSSITECLDSQYQTAPATSTTDRVCAPLTPCRSQFESLPATLTSDRVCAPISACVAGETYQTGRVGRPTPTSDRVCSDCATCDADAQYQRAPCRIAAATVCQALTVCDSSSFETVAPTATTDRQCSSTTECRNSQYQTAPATGSTDRSCADLSRCDRDSEYEMRGSASATTDRMCRPLTECTAGVQFLDNYVSFNDAVPWRDTNHVCSVITVCRAGSQFETVAPTFTSDRSCTASTVCDGSQYEATAGTATSSRICSDLNVCPAGSYIGVAATATTDRECTACLTANRCGIRRYLSGACNPRRTVAPTCEVCSNFQCDTDSYRAGSCENNDGYTCETCANLTCDLGHYRTGFCRGSNNDYQCLMCDNTICPANQYRTGGCGLNALGGFLSRNNYICNDCQECGQDQFARAECTTTTDRQCSSFDSCLASQWQTGPGDPITGLLPCAFYQQCGGDQFESVAPTATSDRGCNATVTCSLPDQFRATPATSTGDAICGPTTPCDLPVQYELMPPTQSTDRICSSVSTCNASLGFFELSAQTATTDRLCSGITECPSTAYITRNATGTADVECTALRVCDYPATQFEDVAPTNYTDRVCADVKACDCEYEYETLALTPTSDRTCARYTRCQNELEITPGGVHRFGNYESTPPTTTTDRMCTPLHVCDPRTEYANVTATYSTDRTCAGLLTCDTRSQYESYASTATSNRECTVLTMCLPNQQFARRIATTTSDRRCQDYTRCRRNNQYEDIPVTTTSDRTCAPITGCSGWETGREYEAAPPTQSSNRDCQATLQCYDLGNYFFETPPDRTTDRVCNPMSPRCAASEAYQSRAGTTTSDRECTVLRRCTGSEFQTIAPTSSTNRVCDSHSAACGRNKYETVAATHTSDRVCGSVREQCAEGTFELSAPTATSNRVCNRVQSCGANEIQTAQPTRTSNRVCSTCPPGQFASRDEGTGGICREVSRCSTTTQFTSVAPTATSDRVCTLATVCPLGVREIVRLTATSDRVCDDDGVTTVASDSTGSSGGDDDDSDKSTLLIITVAVVALLVIGAAIILAVLIAKKKANGTSRGPATSFQNPAYDLPGTEAGDGDGVVYSEADAAAVGGTTTGYMDVGPASVDAEA